MKQEQDNYYLFYCIWTRNMIMAYFGIAWTAFLLAWLKLHCYWCCCIM